MKYCVPYIRNFKYLNEVDEVKISFKTTDLTFIERLAKKEEIINGTAIIEVIDEENFLKNDCLDLFIGLKKKYPEINFKLCFSIIDYNNQDVYNTLKKNNIPFFFRIIPRDLDEIRGLMDLGVSDIYISNELGFSLGKIGAVAHAKGISIRVFGNLAASSWGETYSLKSFFIRPEDVIIYESYVNVIEFIAGEKASLETLYKVYALDKKWPDRLKYIIWNLNSEVENSSLMPGMFAKARLNCGKRCALDDSCNICIRCEEVAETLEEQDLHFNY